MGEEDPSKEQKGDANQEQDAGYHDPRQTDLQEGLLYISQVVQQLHRPSDLDQLVQNLDDQLRRLDLEFSTLALYRLKGEQPPVFESYEVQESGEAPPADQ